MKPSEFIKEIIKYGDFTVFSKEGFEELDKRFIDREEIDKNSDFWIKEIDSFCKKKGYNKSIFKRKILKEIQFKIAEIYNACNDERPAEIQNRIRNFSKWFDEIIEIKALTKGEFQKGADGE